MHSIGWQYMQVNNWLWVVDCASSWWRDKIQVFAENFEVICIRGDHWTCLAYLLCLSDRHPTSSSVQKFYWMIELIFEGIRCNYFIPWCLIISNPDMHLKPSHVSRVIELCKHDHNMWGILCIGFWLCVVIGNASARKNSCAFFVVYVAIWEK